MRILTLVLLAPFTAEFLLGDQYLAGTPELGRQLGMFALYVAFYGAAALLIREAARRAGRGWPTILTLALAFGVFEEGLLTQTLFNPHYLGLDLLSFGHVPGLGIGGPWTLYVLTLHVVWSIGAPIAVAETLFGREPWLKKVGLSLWSVSLVVGAVATFAITYSFAPFVAPVAQLAGAALVVVALAVAAFRFRAPAWTSTPGRPWVAFALGLGASTAFQLVFRLMDSLPWLMVGLLLVIELATVFAVTRLRPPAFPLAAGALITYCWLGLKTASEAGSTAVFEQSALILVTVALLVVTVRRVRTPVSVLKVH
ncbi:hypothetical protein VA596_08870 [Amycolatopsis sp., V23-08]|uniref:DUF998 domain-containing protein n=1 Tax=Amycolatopsis heterodermiae TaxID=3110235 RepID=A0ABU5R2V4_9PSEU|nr:hypothetical protein [Amycolatopsis sp., V23-08]MEA5359646.1 hypothetical protein [Amycolatopsis sp., V23-08]